MADSQIEKEESEEFRKAKQKKRQQYLVVIAVVLVILAASSVVMPAIIRMAEQQEEKEVAEANKMTSKEFKAIIDSYGAAATLAINNYMNSNNGAIPKFEDIKDNIVFDRHEVSCNVTKINYDGSLYLTNCLVDDENIDYKYEYGKELEEVNISKDKLYIFKTSYSKSYGVMNHIPENTSYVQYELLDTYSCKKAGCKGYTASSVSNQALIYDDGNYYLYNIVDKQKIKINLEDVDPDIVDFRLIQSDYKLLGLAVEKNHGKYAVYSLESNRLITDYSYYSVYTTNNIALNNNFIAENGDGTFLLRISDAGLINSSKDYFNISDAADGLYYAVPVDVHYNTSEYKIVVDSYFKPIVKDNSIVTAILNSDNTITGMKNNSFGIYDLNGNLLLNIDKIKSSVKAIKDYIIVIDNNDDLQIYNTKGEKLATLCNVAGNYKVHGMISGWYSTKGKEGIYVVVENKDIPFGTSGSGNEYYYIPSTGEVGVIQTEGVGGYAKPVLYLYPKKKTTVKVSFEHNELLTTTYPKFKNVWKVTANKNGDLYDSKGRYYYGLYWEEEENHNIDFSTGFYVTKDNAIDFLEEKLDKIGFTQREANEFIMYWLPILEKNGKNLVYFELTDEREAYNKLIIEPKVDSLLRVAMHVKKVDQEVNIKEQKLPTFKRKGFTAVEWGGVIH
ncbi:MAG: hypothetical protein Q4E69_05295 [Bacilli bacterium]|nr:hypothetical protein [Bacilli bacterium]